MKHLHIAALLGLGVALGCQTDSTQEVSPSATEAPQGFETVNLKLKKA